TSSDSGIGEIAAGNNQILITVTFTVAANAPVGATSPALSNVNASSDAPQLFTPTATNGMVTILAPTAANASVGGRVLTAGGRSVSKAQVTLTDSQGQVREARSNSFGYFKFTDVQAGETYIITVRSKQYTFSPKVVNVTQDLSDVDLIALPNG
nr:carboxypeptidase regulatory-like domain-containing protein [Pyrinomonadaceae bacterium]